MSPDCERALCQNVIDSALKTVWDVLVVGAGPAGSMAALHLAARGYRVLLLDKQCFPRNKTCGDGLLADALGVLERARLGEHVRQLGYLSHRVSLFSPSRVECEFPWGYVTVKRDLLDALIARKAVEAGAVFCCGKVERVVATANGLIACVFAGGNGVCHARVAVIATGADMALPRKLGLVSRMRASGLAVRCYVRSASGLDRFVISFDRSLLPGYAWIFPMGGQEYNVGCGVLYRGTAHDHTNLRRMFWKFATKFPLARDLMRHRKTMTPVQGAQVRCGLQGVHPSSGDRIVAIGEAIGSTFPATLEGIGKAMETAELAAEVIDETLRSGDLSRLREYPARLETRFRSRYLGYEVAERWLTVPWLVDLMARRARKSKFLQKAIAGIFNETVDPRTIFSFKGLIKWIAD